MMFLTLSGQRSSNPLDQYATVPTEADREAANFRCVGTDHFHGAQANAGFYAPLPARHRLLPYFPFPNLPGYAQNYHLLTTAQSNSTQAGVRYMRSLGKNATLPGGRGGFGGGGGGRRSQNQGLRQSINFNYNWTDSASDKVNIFPQLGGKSSSSANSVQAGYTVGYHKLTSIFNANWNRSTARRRTTLPTEPILPPAWNPGPPAIVGYSLNSSPLNYGLPNVTLSSFTGLSEQQPSFSLSQTISLSES